MVISNEDRKAWGKKRSPAEDERVNEDPTKFRTGIIKNQQLTQMLIDTSNKGKQMISYKNAEQKVILSLKGTSQKM